MTSQEVEFALLVLGFGLGISTRLQFAFRLTIFMLQVIDWWIKSHPHGQKMAAETGLDEEFYNLFGVEMRKYPHLFNSQPRKKPGRKVGWKPKVDKQLSEDIQS